VRNAFHTEIHNLNVNGQDHIANMSDPEIPAALAPAVAGIMSLHDFRPHAMNKPRANYTFTSSGQTVQGLVPADLATIYNLAPLYSKGITGTGQTIAVIEDTDLYSTADWTTFRSTFGLTAYTGGSLTTVHPSITSGNCADPGVPRGGDDGEAILDAEWASAAAPNAAIQVASCASTRTTFGGLIAIQNLLNGPKPPAVMSVSYGVCEAENGAASNSAFGSAYAQAAAEGVSVFVAAGDEGAASCDAGEAAATHGIGVSAWASTPNNVAVGGTDFSDTYHGTTATYWSSTNGTTYGSALSYIPEIPWNDSCASSLWAGYYDFSQTWGTTGFCASRTAQQDEFLEVVAGSGGPSGCATGTPSVAGVVSGTCAPWPKPSWQSGVGDQARDIPDVSLFAGDGAWGHFYVFCFSDRRNGGAPCTGAPSTWAAAGGTSFASPILAGIQALVNQNTGSAQGNPNPVYYSLAASHSCNSSNGDTGNCIFHTVTEGDNDVNCSGAVSCYGAPVSANPGPGRHHGGNGGGQGPTSGAGGVLSTSSSTDSPAYAAGSGWSFAAGLGSVNAYNLVMNWPK
jgi:subtilase family serine protease